MAITELYPGTDLEARGPSPSYFLEPHTGVTCLAVCLKSVKVRPSYVHALSKIYILLYRLWFYDYLRSSTEIKAFPTFFSRTNGSAIFSWDL